MVLSAADVMNNRVVLVSLNAQYFHKEKKNVLPLNLLYLGTALKNNGFEVTLIHLYTKDIDKMVEKIRKIDPLYVGFSVLTGIQVPISYDISKKLKKTGMTIVWGGIHPSLLPDDCLRKKSIDYVIIGEGEETIVEFSKGLNSNNFRPEKIKSLAYKKRTKKGVKIITNPRRRFIKNLDIYKIDWSLLDIEKYLTAQTGNKKKGVYYMTSRGCPYNCGFCYNKVFNDQKWRPFSTQNVIDEINYLKDRFGVDNVMICDDNFFVDKKRAFEIGKKIGIPWRAESRINYITEDFVKNCIDSGCRSLFLGCESGNDDILEYIRKGITRKEIYNAIKILSKHPEISSICSFIVGFPNKTNEQIKDTINLCKKLLKMYKNVSIYVGIYRPEPGTSLYHDAIDNGYKKHKTYDEWGKFEMMVEHFNLHGLEYLNPRLKKIQKIHPYMLLYSSDYFGKFKNGLFARIVQKWVNFRFKNDFYDFSLDLVLLDFLRKTVLKISSMLKSHN